MCIYVNCLYRYKQALSWAHDVYVWVGGTAVKCKILVLVRCVVMLSEFIGLPSAFFSFYIPVCIWVKMWFN